MSKIPFDIKFRPQIESGEYKVVNRIGEEVRIICWDWPDEDCPIVAFDGDRMPSTWGKDGRFMSWRESDSDLFIITPERELSEFEKKLSDIVGYAISMSVSEPKKPTDEFVREYAPQLLSLARKQLQPEIDEAYKTADEVMYRKGKEDGIVEARNDITARIIALKQAKDRAEEALKDLPRWIPNKFDKHNFETCKAYLDTPWYLCYQDKMINVSELVEKLPGFEEDE